MILEHVHEHDHNAIVVLYARTGTNGNNKLIGSGSIFPPIFRYTAVVIMTKLHNHNVISNHEYNNPHM